MEIKIDKTSCNRGFDLKFLKKGLYTTKNPKYCDGVFLVYGCPRVDNDGAWHNVIYFENKEPVIIVDFQLNTYHFQKFEGKIILES